MRAGLPYRFGRKHRVRIGKNRNVIFVLASLAFIVTVTVTIALLLANVIK